MIMINDAILGQFMQTGNNATEKDSCGKLSCEKPERISADLQITYL